MILEYRSPGPAIMISESCNLCIAFGFGETCGFAFASVIELLSGLI